MKLSIMNSNARFPRLGTVSVLAMVMAAGLGCSVQSGAPVDSSSTASVGEFISVALAAPPAFVASTGIVTVTMTDETAEIYVNAADSSLMVNGVQAIDSSVTPHVTAMAAGKGANIKKIAVVDGASAAAGEVLILNYVNGVFGVGTAIAAGTTITYAHGTANTLVVKGTPQIDNFAAGATGISLTNGAKTPTKDITVAGAVGVTAYNFFLGAGDDIFTSSGNAAVVGVFGHPVAIYGGAGNDTLVEGIVSTPTETFSGGPGTDTVDYTLRPANKPVSVAIDPAGLITSGDAATTPGDPTAGATEGDIILDAEVIKGGAGDDFLMGGIAGSVTLNGGLGNDTFCQGDDTYKNGTDTLVGGGGTDTVDYSKRTHSLTVVMDNKTLSGDPTGNVHGEADVIGIDVANMKLGSGGGTYTGNALNNMFFAGTGGSSTVNGLAGDDTLSEALDANNGATEIFHGGAGTDTADYSGRTAALTVTMDGHTGSGDLAGTERDMIDVDVENLYGGTGADALVGNVLDNDIEGNGGGDIISGMAGNDTLVGDPASGTADTAQLHGNDAANTAEPGAFNLCLNTGSGGTPLLAPAAATANCQVFTP
jgi:Ca2+-binding RTX toxin-like protein